MKNLIFNELIILLRSKKNQMLALILIVTAILFSFAVSLLNLGSLAQLKQEEAHYVLGSMDTVSEKERLEDPFSAKYATLLEQESLISKQRMSLIVELDETYLKKEAELNQLQLAITSDPLFADTLPYIPPLYELEHTKVTNKYLTKHKLSRAPDNLNGVNYTIYLSLFLLIVVSLVVTFFSNDILLKDQTHKSVVQGFPVNDTTRIWAKIFAHAFVLYFILVLSLIIGFATMSIRFSLGEINYPVGVYLLHQYKAWPFLKYLALWAFILPFSLIFSLLFAVCLNLVTKNRYITLFAQLFAFFVPYFIPKLSRFTFWLPFDYLNLKRVLVGELAFDSQIPQQDLVTGLLILTAWSLILTLVLELSQRERSVA